jgi:hypothetical protein
VVSSRFIPGFVRLIGGDLWQLEDDGNENRLVKLW